MLSPEIQSQLDEVKQEQDKYRPNEEVCRRLGELGLVMIVGPAAVGKTSVIQTIANLDHEFAPVSVFTTRDPRHDDDPNLFRYYDHTDEGVSELLARINRGDMVNIAIHPTTGHLYGTELEDYRGRYNVLATLANGVKQLNNLPFKTKTIIGLTTEPDTWTKWFDEREMPDRSTREKRLAEAVMALDEELFNIPSITFVSNIEGDRERAASTIIDIAKAPDQARAMRERVTEMLLRTVH